jgi:peptide deformylase
MLNRLVLELFYFPNEFLLKPTTKITEFNSELHDILNQMHHLMELHKGIGLAANQCGVSISAFILQQVNKMDDSIIEIINPEIISESGIQLFNEGCLSAPGVFVTINRPEEIHFKYQDRYGIFHEGIVHGIEAVCFSHELQHLRGEFFLDSTSRPQRKYALKLINQRKR